MVKAGLILAFLVAVASLAWMALLPKYAEHELHEMTGFDVKVPVLSANPFSGRLYIQGLVARNPSGYPSPDFIDIHSLQADVDVLSLLFGDEVRLDNLDLNVGTLSIIRRHDGKTNVGECTAAFSPPRPAGSPATRPTRFLIKRLHIRLESLVVEDDTGSKPDRKTYNLNIDHSYTNVSDARQLLVPDVVHTLYAFGLHHDTARLLPGDFGVALADAVDGVSAVGSKVKDATRKTGEYFKGLFDKLEQSPKP
ncbi:MAG TPA: hypothetical protein VFE25_04535 [Opitutaceae bacterium]|jgi:hypothetical protein|nr:hypothetical protein [Opitutaceae bacterium]